MEACRWLASNQLIQPLGLLRGGIVSSVQPAIGHPAVASIDLFLLGEIGFVSLMTFRNIRVAPIRG